MESEGVSELYRVGRHQPQNIYRGDEYIGVMFNPADADLIVRALNGDEPLGPPEFRDEDGHRWDRWDDELYYLRGVTGGVGLTIPELIRRYGEYGSGA
jgi:hypothetical protein